MTMSQFGTHLVHDAVLQHWHLKAITKDPKLDEMIPAQRLIFLISELAHIKPGMKVVEHLGLDVVQLDLLVGGFYERSIESSAEVVGVERQQIFVNCKLLLG